MTQIRTDTDMKEQKFIYPIVISSPFGTGRFIRAVTKFTYNHAGIAFSPDVCSFYSFSRLYKKATFYGGFVKESILRYKSESYKSHIKVFAVPVTDENYEKIKERISFYEENKEDYIYNLISAAAFIRRKNIKIKNAYTCLEFTLKMVKEFCEIGELNKRDFVSVKDFSEILEPYKIYEGPTEKYFDGAEWENDLFPKKISLWFAVKKTLCNNAKLIKRFFAK